MPPSNKLYENYSAQTHARNESGQNKRPNKTKNQKNIKKRGRKRHTQCAPTFTHTLTQTHFPPNTHTNNKTDLPRPSGRHRVARNLSVVRGQVEPEVRRGFQQRRLHTRHIDDANLSTVLKVHGSAIKTSRERARMSMIERSTVTLGRTHG